MIEELISDIKQDSGSLTSEAEFKELSLFLSEAYQDADTKYATLSLPIDAIDPLACLELLWKSDKDHFYWENPSSDLAIAGGGQLVEISAEGKNRFSDVSRSFEQLKSETREYTSISHSYAGLMVFGGFSFFNEASRGMWKSFEPASLIAPEWLLLKEGKFCMLTLSVNFSEFKSEEALLLHVFTQLRRFSSKLDVDTNATLHQENYHHYFDAAGGLFTNSVYQKWTSSVQQAKKLISKSTFEKIVLARNLTVSKPDRVSPTQVINVLRNQYSKCYSFLVHRKTGGTFLGCTPERLVSIHKNFVLTEALAGSMQRGKTATEDTILEKSLSQSLKNRNEHNFVIRDIEERLSPFVVGIERDSRPEVKKLTNVQHLYTPITARLKNGIDPLTLIEQLHPTPAVGGYPWPKAKPYIRRLESFDRGWYAGPVGWLNSKGGGEFAVGIRSGLLKGDKAHIFAGCGIVEDSDPDTEWEETNLKLMPMLSALQYD